MSDSNSPSHELSGLFELIRSGDVAARNRLMTAIYERIVRLTAVVLRDFPVVQRTRTVESLAQDLSVKMLAALDSGLPTETTADFLSLAAVRLRQLLIDEAEKYRRRVARTAKRTGGTGQTVPLDGGDSAAVIDPAAPASLDPAALAEWTEFQTRVSELPDDERRVVELHFFLQMSQAEVARVLEWEPKKVSRRWLSACAKLADHLPTLD